MVIIITPFFLTLFTLRLMISWNSPGYPDFEYRRIPPDRFGFTQAERLELANATLAYLRRPEPASEAIHLLRDLRLPGTNQPLYSESELGHMFDVKRLADLFRQLLWILVAVAAAGLFFLLARPATRSEGYRAIMGGGLLTAGILTTIVLLILVAWNFVFVQFHELLFPPGTWSFAYSDSLIRLFPEQFWFDFGVIWTVGILVQGILLALVGYVLNRN